MSVRIQYSQRRAASVNMEEAKVGGLSCGDPPHCHVAVKLSYHRLVAQMLGGPSYHSTHEWV